VSSSSLGPVSSSTFESMSSSSLGPVSSSTSENLGWSSSSGESASTAIRRTYRPSLENVPVRHFDLLGRPAEKDAPQRIYGK
jgi:hypothetical protein